MVLPPTKPHPHIREGDLVVVYERFDSMKQVVVRGSGTFGNRFGSFRMQVNAEPAQLTFGNTISLNELLPAHRGG